MASAASPLVSVVMPVYNGAEFIGDAIRSVQTQTYDHFDLTVVNNRSTDRTREIALEFAARDARVRVHDNAEFLNVVENHNKAFSMISDEARYAKILGADDWFFPTCLEELVKVAEAYPSVGMVTSYVLSGTRIGWAGLPYPSTFMSGRAVCRLRLLENVKVFGGPSASLIRASVVRARRPFYDPDNYHGDTEAYLALLREHDFGFVHQVLSYNRKGEKSRTTAYLQRVNSYPAADVHELMTFGPVYLTPDEHARRMREVNHAYYLFLAASVLPPRSREFWHYHLVFLRKLGVRVSRLRLLLYVLGRVADVAFNPLRTMTSVVRRLARLFGGPRPPATGAASAPAATAVSNAPATR